MKTLVQRSQHKEALCFYCKAGFLGTSFTIIDDDSCVVINWLLLMVQNQEPVTSRLVEIDLLKFCLKDESWICFVSAQYIKPFSLLFLSSFFFYFHFLVR